MIDSIIWWTGAIFISVSSFCFLLFLIAIFIQSTLNFLWKKLLRAKTMIEVQDACRMYEKSKESPLDEK